MEPKQRISLKLVLQRFLLLLPQSWLPHVSESLKLYYTALYVCIYLQFAFQGLWVSCYFLFLSQIVQWLDNQFFCLQICSAYRRKIYFFLVSGLGVFDLNCLYIQVYLIKIQSLFGECSVKFDYTVGLCGVTEFLFLFAVLGDS